MLQMTSQSCRVIQQTAHLLPGVAGVWGAAVLQAAGCSPPLHVGHSFCVERRLHPMSNDWAGLQAAVLQAAVLQCCSVQ